MSSKPLGDDPHGYEELYTAMRAERDALQRLVDRVSEGEGIARWNWQERQNEVERLERDLAQAREEIVRLEGHRDVLMDQGESIARERDRLRAALAELRRLLAPILAEFREYEDVHQGQEKTPVPVCITRGQFLALARAEEQADRELKGNSDAV